MSDETVTEPVTVKFFDDTFTINGDVSEFALLEFAEAASDGQDGDTMQGLASMLRLVIECIDEKDRARFKATARKHRAKAADLTPVIDAAFNGVADRPTVRSSDSSDGPPSIEPKSEVKRAVSTSQLDGRPDLQLAVKRMRQPA